MYHILIWNTSQGRKRDFCEWGREAVVVVACVKSHVADYFRRPDFTPASFTHFAYIRNELPRFAHISLKNISRNPLLKFPTFSHQLKHKSASIPYLVSEKANISTS